MAIGVNYTLLKSDFTIFLLRGGAGRCTVSLIPGPFLVPCPMSFPGGRVSGVCIQGVGYLGGRVFRGYPGVGYPGR